MKKITYLAIPVIIVIVLLGGAFVWKMMTPIQPPEATRTGSLPDSLSQATGTKPSNPFSVLFGSQSATPIPTPTPASAASMHADLQTVGDDGGAADFASLQSQVSGL